SSRAPTATPPSSSTSTSSSRCAAERRKPGVALWPGRARQLLHGGVKAPPVPALLLEQRHEGRHQVVVGALGCKAGVVGALHPPVQRRQPGGLQPGRDPPGAQLAIGRGKFREDRPLAGRALCLLRRGGGTLGI